MTGAAALPNVADVAGGEGVLREVAGARGPALLGRQVAAVRHAGSPPPRARGGQCASPSVRPGDVPCSRGRSRRPQELHLRLVDSAGEHRSGRKPHDSPGVGPPPRPSATGAGELRSDLPDFLPAFRSPA